MKKTIIKHFMLSLIGGIFLLLGSCGTVRDTTDWIPGIDSNEEIQQAKQQQAQQAIEEERQRYEDKVAFAPTTPIAAHSDAKISVSISQKLNNLAVINRQDIGIDVTSGVVTLTGSVPSDEGAIQAITAAKSTLGVSRVISKLVVMNIRVEVELPISNHSSSSINDYSLEQ
jgi:osmotically-inducible protein OsmY